jgi:hypothetical protein
MGEMERARELQHDDKIEFPGLAVLMRRLPTRIFYLLSPEEIVFRRSTE